MGCVPELDDEYIERMEDVLEVYEKPVSAEEPVVCVDEKTVTLHGDVREPIPMKPGSVAKQDSEYQRCGTANAFCAVEPRRECISRRSQRPARLRNLRALSSRSPISIRKRKPSIW